MNEKRAAIAMSMNGRMGGGQESGCGTSVGELSAVGPERERAEL